MVDDNTYGLSRKIRKILNEARVYPDVVKASKREVGTVEVRSTFFYRHGRTAEGHGESVAKGLEGSPFQVVRSVEDWSPWPKNSYFTTFVRRSP